MPLLQTPVSWNEKGERCSKVTRNRTRQTLVNRPTARWKAIISLEQFVRDKNKFVVYNLHVFKVFEKYLKSESVICSKSVT